jgi:hypothetical protein
MRFLITPSNNPWLTATSAPPGDYLEGQSIYVTLTYSEPVRVIGAPYLVFSKETGPYFRIYYFSGSGTPTLTFRYIVARYNYSPGTGNRLDNFIHLADFMSTYDIVSVANGTHANSSLPNIDVTGIKINYAAPEIVTGDFTAIAGVATNVQVVTKYFPSTLTAQGLPPGLALLNSSSISGTPTTVGSYPVTIVATNPQGTATKTITVNVVPAGSGSKSPQTIDFVSPVSAILINEALPLGATASSGLPVTYSIVSGPATMDANWLTVRGAGPVVVRATQAGNDTFTPASADITVTGTAVPVSRLVNLSSRARVSDGDSNRTFIAGFVVSGTSPKPMLLRAVGPTLTSFGVTNALPNPRLQLFDNAGRLIAENEDWNGADVSAAFTRLGAFDLPAGSKDAALLTTLSPGAYSFHVVGNGGTGVALAEVYDASSDLTTNASPLINISSRGYVDTGEGALIAGFVVTGNAPKRVLVRAIGPALQQFGVSGVVADPKVTVYQNGVLVAQNDNWQTPQSAGTTPGASGAEIAAATSTVGAFALASGSSDAALIVTLQPGSYSAVATGANGSVGAGLVEIYEVP